MITGWLTDHQTLVILVQFNIIVTLILLQTALTVDGINTFDDGSCNRIITLQLWRITSLPIPLEFPLVRGVMDIPWERGRGAETLILKELITLGPAGLAGLGDFPLIFMGGGTKTVLTWRGRVGGGEGEGAPCGRKVENCLGAPGRRPDRALAGGTWTAVFGRSCLMRNIFIILDTRGH